MCQMFIYMNLYKPTLERNLSTGPRDCSEPWAIDPRILDSVELETLGP
jgi:hypothetical protein